MKRNTPTFLAVVAALVAAVLGCPLVSLAQGNPPPGGPATITEYSIPAGLSIPHGVAKEEGLVASGQGNAPNIWFTVLSGDAVVRLDPQTAVETTYPIPGGPREIVDIRVTPNGKVWFNTSDGDVGMLDPKTSTLTLYDTSAAFVPALGFLDWLHVDQFGNVWNAELGGSRIVVLNPRTGVATAYTTGAGFTSPAGLARRRSGDVWWCERGTGLIGRLDVRSSIITHYTTPFSALEGCALDPKGDPEGLVWVTPGFAGAPSDGIGSLDPRALTFTLYTTPTAASNPYGVAIGCAGSVVFGEDAAAQIGVLVPSLATGVASASTATSAAVTPVSATPATSSSAVTPSTSTASVTTGTSTPTVSGGFSEYPVLTPGLEGPHLVLVGPNEKVVYSQFLGDADRIGVLELPPAARCRQQ